MVHAILTYFIHLGELLVIVEYCRFGSLQNYLIKHRNNFINQLDEFGNLIKIDYNGAERTNYLFNHQAEKLQEKDGYLVMNSPESFQLLGTGFTDNLEKAISVPCPNDKENPPGEF